MKVLLVAASLVVSVAAAGAQNLSLSPTELADAIKQGRAGKTLQKKCRASGENGFDIVIQGPVGRVMRAANEAKQKDRDFTTADVSLALDGPFLTVTTRRDWTLSTASSAVAMEGAPGVWVLPETAQADRRRERLTMGSTYHADVVLMTRDSGSRQPIVLKPMAPVSFTTDDTARTGKISGNRPLPDTSMSAIFDLAAFRALPPSTVEVVVFMTDAGEHRCKISDKDRQRIR